MTPQASLEIRIAQLAVGRDLGENLRRMLEVLGASRTGELVVFPEGMLSGYAPAEEGYAAGLDARAIEDAIGTLRRRAAEAGCRCLFGSATRDAGGWRNSALLLDGSGEPRRYHKAELSGLDRRHFSPGPAAGELFDAGGVPVGVLACRELLFPGAWTRLKERGAKVIVHLNNALEAHDALWSHFFIARAIEQSVFVCSVNNGAAPQALPSVLVSPSGRVVLRTKLQEDEVIAARIDLGEVIGDLSSRADY
jgi:predicted amidohydrolase